MKLQALAATLLAVAAMGGSAVAQVTMQPIPNPPEKPMMHKAMMKHHAKKHMMKPAAKSADDMAAPAPK